MPNYKYIARDAKGAPVEGFQAANTDDELVAILQAQGLIVISFKRAGEQAKAAGPRRKKKMHPGVKLDDLIIFSKQLRALLEAGVTLLRSLEIVSLQLESKALNDAIENIKQDVSGGLSFKDAVAKHPKVFSNLWINIIETGEATGKLPFALEQLAGFLESQSALQRKIIGALTYPAAILCVAAIAVGVFIVRIIPMFSSMYADFGAELPAFTQLVFGIALFIKKYLLFIIGVFVAAALGFNYYIKTREGRRRFDTTLLNMPIFGEIVRQVAAVRFASGLSMLIKSGTPILQALDIVSETSGNVLIKDMLIEVKESVREGKGMSQPLIAGGIFPDILSHMVAVGEESGELANMLESVSKFYAERVDAAVSRLTTIFEPLLIVCIGAIVGTLIIAMFLPIFGLSGAMK